MSLVHLNIDGFPVSVKIINSSSITGFDFSYSTTTASFNLLYSASKIFSCGLYTISGGNVASM